MRFLIDFFLALVLVILFFFGIGFLLPPKATVERSMMIERPTVQIYDALNSLARFPLWSPLAAKDKDVAMEVSGPRDGTGSRVDWQSTHPDLGNGFIEITGNEDSKGVAYNLNLGPERSGVSRVVLIHKEQDYGTRVVWNFTVDYGDNILRRFKGLYLDAYVGDTLHLSMLRLKYMLENTPYGADYSTVEIVEKELTPAPAYTITATAKCFAEAGQSTCIPNVPEERAKAQTELEAFLKKNKINVLGKPQFALVSKEPYTVTFDLQLPVDRNDSKPSGTIQATQTLGGKVVVGEHVGFMDNTEPTWEKIMAYMTVRGMRPLEGLAGRQVDEYMSDPKETEAQFFTTNVYQPVQ